MSDIVERLRKMAEADYYGHDHFVPPEECADEIERLREALEVANEDAQKLALRLEGESNLVAELSRRLAALEAKS